MALVSPIFPTVLIMQFFIQDSCKCILELIINSSVLLKKDETYFIGISICVFLKIIYVLKLSTSPAAGVASEFNPDNKFDLYLKESELSSVTSTKASPAKVC